VDENVEAKSLLLTDNEFDLLLDEPLVLLGSDLTLGELLTVDTDLLGLRKNGEEGRKTDRLSVVGAEEGQNTNLYLSFSIESRNGS